MESVILANPAGHLTQNQTQPGICNQLEQQKWGLEPCSSKESFMSTTRGKIAYCVAKSATQFTQFLFVLPAVLVVAVFPPACDYLMSKSVALKNRISHVAQAEDAARAVSQLRRDAKTLTAINGRFVALLNVYGAWECVRCMDHTTRVTPMA